MIGGLLVSYSDLENTTVGCLIASLWRSHEDLIATVGDVALDLVGDERLDALDAKVSGNVTDDIGDVRIGDTGTKHAHDAVSGDVDGVGDRGEGLGDDLVGGGSVDDAGLTDNGRIAIDVNTEFDFDQIANTEDIGAVAAGRDVAKELVDRHAGRIGSTSFDSTRRLSVGSTKGRRFGLIQKRRDGVVARFAKRVDRCAGDALCENNIKSS